MEALLDARGERARNSDGWKEPSGRQKFFGWRDSAGRAITVAIEDITVLCEHDRGGFTMTIRSVTVKGDTYQHLIDMATGFRLMKIMGWEAPRDL